MKRKVLITGGMGFIGTAMTNFFAKACDVTVVDRLDFGVSNEVQPLIDKGIIELVEADLAIVSNIYKRIEEGEFDEIIHLASLTHIPFCEAYPDFAYHSNVLSFLNIVSRLPQNSKLINFSTSSTYSPEDKLHVEATSGVHPTDFYGWSKKHAEDLGNYYAQRKKLSLLHIRLANAAGYGETNPKLIGTILTQVHNGQSMVELGNLTPRRDFIHIDDIAWSINQLLEIWPVELGKHEVFNLGTGYEPISVKELFDKIVKCTGRDIKLKSVEERKRKIERELLCVDASKFIDLVKDYRPKKVDDWLCQLVREPGLRIDNKIEEYIQKWRGR